jgi:hypothetical protein
MGTQFSNSQNKWATDMRPPAPAAPAAPYQAPKISPFMWNMFGSMKTMDVEERADYLQNLASGIKDKLDQYGLRLARGAALTPEQQTRYDSLRTSFSDIQGYITNQSAYDDYLDKLGNLTPEQYDASQAKAADIANRKARPWDYGMGIMRPGTF